MRNLGNQPENELNLFGVQAEAGFAHRKRRVDDHAGASREGKLAQLGAGWSEAGDRCGGELRQRRILRLR